MAPMTSIEELREAPKQTTITESIGDCPTCGTECHVVTTVTTHGRSGGADATYEPVPKRSAFSGYTPQATGAMLIRFWCGHEYNLINGDHIPLSCARCKEIFPRATPR